MLDVIADLLTFLKAFTPLQEPMPAILRPEGSRSPMPQPLGGVPGSLR